MAVAGKPLRLKDLLELDCDSCSAAGFRCYPRHLCVAVPLSVRHEAAEVHGVLGRSHSLRHPMLSIRSLSRRLRGSFSWSRRDEEAASVAVATSSISSSGSETSESGSSSTKRKSESDFSSASSAESLYAGVTTTTDEHEHEAMKRGSKEGRARGSGSEEDGQEQLSPVSVMDFPFEDDEDSNLEEHGRDAGDGTCSPSFRDSLAQLHQRRNIQLHHKIRRYRSIGEVGAVDLDERFAVASDPEVLVTVPAEQLQHSLTDAPSTPRSQGPKKTPRSHRSVDVCQDPNEQNLLALLTGTDVSDRLLLDFFAETGKLSSPENFEAALRAAEGLIEGTGPRWGLKEVLCGRDDLLAEMDRNRRWSARVGGEEEEREIGVAVAGLVIDELVHELVRDLLL